VNGWLGWERAHALLDEVGIALVDEAVLRDPSEADAVELPFPVVAKVVADAPIHKVSAGLIRFGISDHAALKAAAEELFALIDDPTARVLVQPMVRGGIELYVGAVRDPEMGAVVGVGLGGVAVEEVDRVAFRSCRWLTATDVDELLAESGVAALLTRLGRADATTSVRDMAHAAAALLLQHDDIDEFEVNPVLVHAGGVHGVDVRMRATDPTSRD
jgi:acetyltransferase